MIEVRGLKKSIRNGNRTIEILKRIDLLIPAGQFLAIMGASGSGKSTLLGLLAGLDSPTEGDVLIDGTEISHLPEDKLAEVRGRKLGFVFQSFQLIPTLTALGKRSPASRTERLRRRPRSGCQSIAQCRPGRPHASLSDSAFRR